MVENLAKMAGALAFAGMCVACSSSVKNEPKQADLKLEPGFSATIIADSLGAARHLTVSQHGDVYVKLNGLKDGKGIYCLSDTDGDGVIDKTTAFGNYTGTGILMDENYLYASSNTTVYRYKLDEHQQVIDADHPEVVVDGLVARAIDGAKPLVIDKERNLYVAVASYSDACADETKDGKSCPLLDSVAGIWQFKADKLGQGYSDGERYATGLKGVMGFAWNDVSNSLYALQHGRGNFHEKFPLYFDASYSATYPAETLYELSKGADAGWPYIYYDHVQHKKLQAPEFGGDGKKEGDNKYLEPALAFPAHLGPNAMLFYTGDMFPEKYKNGAFVAFHNQSPELHKGFCVAFVPFKDGKPSGDWEIFADGFAGIDLENPSGPSQHKPCGLAQGPDGTLYVSDDLQGTIYKIAYSPQS
ncbi:sorbosone dehydrogenase family protein [Olivibacter sp. XZL3]|uniref:PQQ-dependent sugar dehydrogenase n=1 Tax=Olivibacter sp. XZL3 TaxID=1735116 RepID=UPI001065914E|nr:PQQ-dependent sugar dehydrogenase [Olivibacter sp. XZL3]